MGLSLDFTIIRDESGFGSDLLLKGDWIVLRIGDGRHVGLGEATHSGDDETCVRTAGELFERHVRGINLDLECVRGLELGPLGHARDRVTATAVSGVNQALYDLLAKRRHVPVWRLFSDTPLRRSLGLYATINRCLKSRTVDEYLSVASLAIGRGFTDLKCAPFEAVTPDGDQVAQSEKGLGVLRALKEAFPGLSLRVDFHRRFSFESFMRLLPQLNDLDLAWIEEPTPLDNRCPAMRRAASSPLAAGESYFGVEGFRPIIEGRWADVVMPDVKHVGGFGPLVDVCRFAAEHNVEVSPHNPSGPVSTVASAHVGALFDNVRSLEYPFDRDGARAVYNEPIRNGRIVLPDGPGWGIEI